MKKVNHILALSFAIVAITLVSCFKDNESLLNVSEAELAQQSLIDSERQANEAHVISYTSNVIPGQYIVVYKDDALAESNLVNLSYPDRQQVMKEKSSSTVRESKIPIEKIKFVYGTALKGFSLINTTETEIEQLIKDPQIAYIEQDQTISVSMGGPPGGGGGGGGQQTPWGITRVNGGVSGAGLKAWIIDSGIDLDHPDLNVDVANSANFARGNSANDGNGHGTHVAGTVAALDNTEGVIGVAAGASVVAVRVLNNNGSGSTSGVIAGVNYVGASAGSNDVANMSLGGGVSTALDNAVIAASGTCPFALAAGNESNHASNHSPARANGPNIYTVASMTSSNSWSSFSNYGQPPVDYIAPGSSVYSTYKGGGYATLSGTSMASPHVCGILLLGNISNGGTVTRVAGDVYTVASH